MKGTSGPFPPQQILEDLGYRRGEIDLLFGGPPCQAFSQIGKQQALSDERGMLLFQMVRYAEIIQPRAVLVEQVKGLLTVKDLSGRRGGVFERFLGDLERLGYMVSWQVLLAADYGVPQMRERVFVAAMKGLDGFAFPAPTHGKVSDPGGLLPYVSAGEAIAGLGAPLRKADAAAIPDNSHYDVTPPRDRERIHGVPEGKNLSSQNQLPKEQIGGLTRKDTTKFLRLDRSKPANTLRGGEIFFHPTEDRYLTPREYLRLHGYPDSYVLRGSIRGRSGRVKCLDQHRQAANSVPPPLAAAVAKAIRERLAADSTV